MDLPTSISEMTAGSIPVIARVLLAKWNQPVFCGSGGSLLESDVVDSLSESGVEDPGLGGGSGSGRGGASLASSSSSMSLYSLVDKYRLSESGFLSVLPSARSRSAHSVYDDGELSFHS